jgi:hypothetical protein
MKSFSFYFLKVLIFKSILQFLNSAMDFRKEAHENTQQYAGEWSQNNKNKKQR